MAFQIGWNCCHELFPMIKLKNVQRVIRKRKYSEHWFFNAFPNTRHVRCIDTFCMTCSTCTCKNYPNLATNRLHKEHCFFIPISIVVECTCTPPICYDWGWHALIRRCYSVRSKGWIHLYTPGVLLSWQHKVHWYPQCLRQLWTSTLVLPPYSKIGYGTPVFDAGTVCFQWAATLVRP